MNNKLLKILNFSVLSLLFLSFATAQDKKPDATSLKQVAIPINSIDLSNDDFSDLMPIAKKIGNAKIVMLGEATHAEGTTSQAKARFVKFLHEKMGFDILVWESGMFSAFVMNSKLRDLNIPISEARKYISTWGSEEPVIPLLEYSRKTWKSDRPLIMSGMDRSRTEPSAEYFTEYFRQFFSRVPELSFNQKDWKTVETFAERAFNLQRPKDQLPSDEVRKTERELLLKFLQKIKSNRNNLKNKFSEMELIFAERFVQDALDSEKLNYTAATDFPKFNQIRDKMMADNLLWQIEHLYPNRKIIIWAATAHLLRNGEAIKNVAEGWTHPDWYTGNQVYPILKDDIYTIAFTAYGGELGFLYEDPERKPQSGKVENAPADSFEGVAHTLGNPYLFVDIKNAPANHWLANSFVSLATGRNINVGIWKNTIDAFFFIDEAKPRRFLQFK